MPLSINHLPPTTSITQPPAVLPGQEPTAEQKAQMTMAQIAGIVAAVGVSKVAIMDATTLQISALLRSSNLLNQAGVAAFARAAAEIVQAAITQTKNLAWSGAAARSQLLGMSFNPDLPIDRNIPKQYRYSRKTPLEKAYARLAEEYAKELERTPDDPLISELVRQYEDAGLTPVPRMDNLSSDAVRRPSEQKWKEAFQESQQKQGEIASRILSERESETAKREARVAEARERAEAERAERDARAAAKAESQVSSGDGQPNSPNRDSEAQPNQGRADQELEQFRLNDLEVATIIERHAQQKVEELAQRMVETDIQSSYRNVYSYATKKMPKEVIGYRRVVHPELNKSGQSCGLCIVASTMVYSKGDLLPIHASCKCEVAEVYELNGEIFDPGEQINMEDLKAFYSEAQNSAGNPSTHGWDLKRQRYEIVEHPEYGTALVNVNKKRAKENIAFTGRKVTRNGKR